MPLRALATGGKGPLFIWAPCYPRLLHPTAVEQGVVVEGNHAIDRMAGKFPRDQRRQRGMGLRAGHRGIGRGVEPPQHAVEIEQLAVGETIEPVLPLEESLKILFTQIAVIDLLIIPRIGAQARFISLEKWGVGQPVVPDEGNPATGSEQPPALCCLKAARSNQ